MDDKLKVGVLGSGNIGTDLIIKVLRSKYLTPTILASRNISSPGMLKAKSLNIPISDNAIEYIVQNPDCCDLVFDATSAKSHLEHAPILKSLGKKVIDLTPSNIGSMCIPAVNIKECLNLENVNMITCGGQASIPLAFALGSTHSNIDYIEVISSIASKSAGPATRMNLDEYIHTTELGIKNFSGAHRTKAILNLNPAEPCVNMQTTLFAKIENPDLPKLKHAIHAIVEKIKHYVPGYELIMEPTFANSRIAIMVRVRGLGDYLPAYAGNLDIINCAAIAMAEEYAKSKIK